MDEETTDNQDEIGRALFINWGKTPPPDATETNRKIARFWLTVTSLFFVLVLIYEVMKG